MDNFMDNPWFVRIVALLLTVFLFITANDLGRNTGRTTPNEMENDDTDTIANVPVEIYYDSENLVVTGVPETVNVRLQGQRRFVEAAKRQRDFTVFVDLSNTEIGRHRVPILYKDISDKLKVTIEPAFADINLQEKVSETFSVEAEFNRSVLAEGFEAEQPEVDPKTVTITGGKDVVEKITYVKAVIDVSGLIDETIKKEALVQVFDRELNKLDVQVEPRTVSVTIPVTNPRKNVAIRLKQTGTPPEDIEIKTISTSNPEVMIFGRSEILAGIEELEVPVDVSNIHEDTEFEIPLKFPTGVNKITPDKIKVKIIAEEKKYEKTFENMPISLEGLREDLDAEITSPTPRTVSLTIKATRSELEKVKREDFKVIADLSGLYVGEHELPLEVKGPENIEWELNNKRIVVMISHK